MCVCVCVYVCVLVSVCVCMLACMCVGVLVCVYRMYSVEFVWSSTVCTLHVNVHREYI